MNHPIPYRWTQAMRWFVGILTLIGTIGTAAAAPAYVQSRDVRVTSGRTAAVSFSSSTTRGNLIVVYLIWNNTGTATVADNNGNTYVSANGPTRWHSNQYSVQIFYARNIRGGANTVTATFATTISSFGSIYVHEYSGLDTAAPLDVSSGATGSSGTSISSGSATTTASSGLLFGAGVSDTSVTTPGTGYTARLTSYGDLTMDRVVTSAGSYNASARNNGGAWALQMVAFKAASTADTTAPSAPSGLAANAASATQINLSWTASTDNVAVAGYGVYRNGTLVGTTAGTTYSDTGLTSYTTYSYTIAAYDAANNVSASSNTAAARTLDSIAPTVPTGLAATATSSSQVALTWTASTDNASVTGYRVYRNGSQIATASSTSYSDSGLSSYTSYTYTVAAYDAAGNISAQSSAANARTLDSTAPSVPTGLTATAVSTSQINLSWTASTDNAGVLGYGVYRNGAFISTSSTTSYSSTGLATGTTYTFTVVAYDAASNVSAASSPASATTLSAPSAPVISSFAASPASIQSGQSSTLSWSTSGATSLSIDRGVGTVTGSTSTSVSPTATTVYTLSATNASGTTTAQATVTVTADAVAPSTPTGLAPTVVSSSQINLLWTASTDNIGVTGYRVYRNGTLVGTSATTSYSDTGLTSYTNYTYAVAAYDAAGNASAQSSTVSARTLDSIAPSVPSGLTATAVSTSQINLSWTASTDNSGVAGYGIYRNGSFAATSTTTSYSDTGLSAGTTYSYTVVAYDAANNVSAASTVASATTNSAPTAPVISSFAASPSTLVSGQSATLSWSTSGATSLSIDRGVGVVTGSTSTTVSPTTTTIYTLSAVNATGTTTAQATVTVSTDTSAPTTPTNVVPNAISSSQIGITWSASTDNVGVARYAIYRNGTQIGISTVTSYSDTGLTANTTYTYTIVAIDAAGNASAPSVAQSEATFAAATGNYSTNFPLNEATISENGSWKNGKTDGLSWCDVRTSGGVAYGTQTGSNGFDDSTAILTGAWGPDQTVQGTVYTVNQNESAYQEVELRLRSAISAQWNSGYEVTFRCSTGSGRYIQIVRWNGPLGSFNYINTTTGPGLKNGDVVKATMIGTLITVYVNNVQVLQGSDSTFATGSPGIGFYLQDGPSSMNQDFGFTTFSATDGSSADTTPPTAPTSLTATTVSPSQINLTWNASTDNIGVVGYQVYRNGSAVGVSSSTSYSDTGLSSGASYTYAVVAFDAAGNSSAASGTATASTPQVDVVAPSVPTGLQSPAQTTNTVTLTWTASTDNVAVAGYRVYRNGTQVGTTATTDYTDSGLSVSTTYAYTVSAYDSSGNSSAQSGQLAVTTRATAAAAPTYVQGNRTMITSGSSTSVAFSSSTTAGNAIVVFVIWSNTASVTVTDSRGSTFVSVGSPIAWTSGYRAQVFYATNIAGGSDTVTATYQSPVSSFGVLYVHEYKGINPTNPVDTAKSAVGASSTLSSGSMTTTYTNDLLFCACVSDNTMGGVSAGFTLRSNAYGNLTEDRAVASPGAYTTTATHNGSSWGMQVVAFRPLY